MTFYTDLRDNVAGPLIAQFGSDATLRQEAISYDPATGAGTATATNTAVKVLQVSLSAMLKGSGGKNVFSEEMSAKWDQGIIMQAVAGGTPAVNDLLILGSVTARIAWIDPVQPGGVPVIYKMAVARA